MELRHYILTTIDDLLRDAVADEARTLVRREANQLVDYLDDKWTKEQQQQILSLLKGEVNPSAYPADIASAAERVLGWFKVMRSTATRPAIMRDHLSELYAPPLLNPAFFVKLAGPLCGGVGWLIEYQWLFWVGVGFSGLTLFLNLASGVLKLPTLPILFMLISAWSMSSWYVGAGIGLLMWTGLELIGEIVGRVAKDST